MRASLYRKKIEIFYHFNGETNVGIVNEIKIQLRDQTGELIEFVDNTKPVVFNLTVKH